MKYKCSLKIKLKYFKFQIRIKIKRLNKINKNKK